MATTNLSDDIIEKKASAPVATSCLVIACVALIGAIVFQLIEIGELRSDVRIPTAVRKGVGQDLAASDVKKLGEAVQAAIAAAATAGGGEAGTKLDATPPGGSSLKEEPPADEESTDAKAPAGGSAKEEPAANEPAADESAEEPAAEK